MRLGRRSRSSCGRGGRRSSAASGRGIAERLRELVETGRIAELDELEQTVSPELIGFGRLLGIGPQRMLEIGRTLGIRSAGEFREAAHAGRLREVPGVGPKTERRILERLDAPPRPERHGLLLNEARTLVEEIAEALDGEVAGDARRWADVCRDLTVVVASARPQEVLHSFEDLAAVVAVVEREPRRALGVTVEGVPVELVVAEPDSFGTTLLRATGTKAYVDALEPLPAAADEAGVYAALELPWCPPELREAPFRGEPPPLVELGDVRGDLHCHTTWSDGKASVLEMATAARDRGYEYMAVCDHTRAVRVVPGLDADDLRRQAEEIAQANEQLAPFRVLRGTEVDIRSDGSLDLPDDVLAELEWVQLSLHAGQREAREPLTRKVTEAMRHPAVRCLSHPRGTAHQPPPSERSRPRDGVRGGSRDRRRPGDERPGAPPRSLGPGGSAGGRGRSADRRLDRRPFRSRAREHEVGDCDGEAWLGDRC